MDTNIHFLIPLPEHEGPSDYSPLQGFSRSLPRRFTRIRPIIRHCPPNIIELYSFSPDTLALRTCGQTAYRAVPIEVSALPKLRLTEKSPFAVLILDDETRDGGVKWRNAQTFPVMLIDVDDPKIDASGSDLPQRLRQHCDAVIDLLVLNGSRETIEKLERLRCNPQPRDSFDVGFPFLGHNTTIPNELALCSVGGEFTSTDTPLVGDDDKYVAAIIRSADPVFHLRRQLEPTAFSDVAPPLPSVIVTSPGLYKWRYQDRLSKTPAGRRFLKYLRLIWRKKTYAYQLDGDAESDLKGEMEAFEFQFLISLRTEELVAYTDALAIRAASQLCPVLRLPPAVNHVSAEVTRLADCIRGKNPQLHKIRRLAEQLFAKLKESAHPNFQNRIAANHTGITLVSDAPLEWLPVKGLPLMLRNTTSRISSTPGNLSFMQILPHDDLNLTMDGFHETLVLRSFKSNDSARRQLEKAVLYYQSNTGTRLPVRFVDVHNRDDLIAALNGFTGAMAVLDSHGSHERRDDIGRIHLVEGAIDVSELEQVASFPPIMMTCACDTHALDRSHATVANALAMCGVRSVIATILPVISAPAAITAARFLFRVYQFLPLVTQTKRSIRWNEVFSQFQRMEFVSEIFRMLEDHMKIDSAKARDVHVRSTTLCHKRDTAWYEEFVDDLAATLGITAEQIEELRQKHLPFPETLKYVHLGNPDSIVIQPDDHELLGGTPDRMTDE